MGERKLIETARRVGLPIVLALGLTGTLAACGDDAPSVKQEMQTIFDTSSKQCAENAQTIFDEQFPAVVISDKPDVEELTVALESLEARESDGEAVKTEAYDNCMETNFFGFEPVVSSTTLLEEVPATTEGN